MSALRFNDGKPALSYILQFPSVVEVMAHIMTLGAAKYGDLNWKKGGKPDKEYLDSMMRHLMAFLNGEVLDPDSGCAHLGHAIWNLCALLELNHSDNLVDIEHLKAQCKVWSEKSKDLVPNMLIHSAPALTPGYEALRKLNEAPDDIF